MSRLITIDAEKLLDLPLKKPEFLVDGLLHRGLTVLAGAAVTWFFLKWASGHAYPGYRREGLISMYGMLTGTIGSGILLLKEIDPNLDTPAANNLVIGSSYGIVLGAPMLVFVSLAARSTLMCVITFALIVIYWLMLSLLIRKK